MVVLRGWRGRAEASIIGGWLIERMFEEKRKVVNWAVEGKDGGAQRGGVQRGQRENGKVEEGKRRQRCWLRGAMMGRLQRWA